MSNTSLISLMITAAITVLLILMYYRATLVIKILKQCRDNSNIHKLIATSDLLDFCYKKANIVNMESPHTILLMEMLNIKPSKFKPIAKDVIVTLFRIEEKVARDTKLESLRDGIKEPHNKDTTNECK